ncbi:MAG: hypothetical protein EBY18_20965, partial [Alphaproteobacteria bacterium]|nr:hypothetical protein [Alphaproteobacteria bacterium]
MPVMMTTAERRDTLGYRGEPMANDKTNGKSDDGKTSQIQTWLSEQYGGTYADGRRCDELGYLQCKLILKPDRFTSIHVFKEFAALVQRAAVTAGVGFQPTPKSQQRPEVREVLFLDTGDYHLYNNSFICRRRIAIEMSRCASGRPRRHGSRILSAAARATIFDSKVFSIHIIPAVSLFILP